MIFRIWKKHGLETAIGRECSKQIFGCLVWEGFGKIVGTNITRWFNVTFWSPVEGHLTIPKRSHRIARQRTFSQARHAWCNVHADLFFLKPMSDVFFWGEIWKFVGTNIKEPQAPVAWCKVTYWLMDPHWKTGRKFPQSSLFPQTKNGTFVSKYHTCTHT